MDDLFLLRALKGEVTQRVPFWFMRQAGRYLPEYRELRATAKDFLDLCFTSEKAAEVTLQPIRRFGMDGAILFSDILVIPHAMGAQVAFTAGEGPVVEQTINPDRIAQLYNDVPTTLAPVFDTIRIVRRELPKETTLLGFAGSPWTVACYMLQGPRGHAAVKEFATAKRFAYAEPTQMQTLISKLVEATIDYLRLQIDAGVNAVQLFDSWSGLLSPEQFARWVIAPTQQIVAALKQSHPTVPVIGFAKGSGANLTSYASQTGVGAIGIDQHTPMDWAITQRAHAKQAVQGNLDPLLVAADAAGAVTMTQQILQSVQAVPCVFNLGHGFVPDTPIAHVEAVCEVIRNHRRT